MIYKNADINGVLTDIEVEDGKIKYIGKLSADGFDLCQNRVFPGLCDTHSHGMIGYDTMDGDGLIKMSVPCQKRRNLMAPYNHDNGYGHHKSCSE